MARSTSFHNHKIFLTAMESLKKFLLPESQPSVAANVFIARGAIVLGAVELHEQSSVWYGSVLRGDINRIVVGAQSNVQDGSVLHVSDDCACVLGERVTVGHRAVVHACTVGDEVLVGMGAIILDGAQIGASSIIAAGALVTKNSIIPEGSLVVGSPARVVRSLSLEERQANAKLALKYVEVSRRYLAMGLGGGVVPIAV
jgi:gamma-carbonic anhydrase